MESRAFTILLYLLIGGALSATLHILIGIAQRAAVARFVSALPQNTDGPLSLKRLLFDWSGKALRMAVWVLYFAFVVNLLPQTRSQLENVNAKSLWDKAEFAKNWLFDGGIRVVIIIVVTIFLMRFVRALIRTTFILYERSAAGRDQTAVSRRLQTLTAILRGTIQTVILFIGMMVLLSTLQVPIAPILASAGVVGIAVGFGAQSLIKDLFAGFLILLEDQYSVGDTVKIGESAGTVEELTLRVTRIRGIDGSLTTIPNGSIAIVSNMSKDWSRVVMDVEVSYDEDVDRAMSTLLEIARQMKKDHPYEIIEEPTMLGIDKMNSTGVTLRLMVKTSPARHFDLGRDLRRRIKLAFEREGIKAPLPQQQLILSTPIHTDNAKG